MAPPFSKPYIETSPKRVRVLFGGQWIVDTQAAKLVWEKPFYPTYFFDSKDIPDKFLRPSDSQPDDGTELFDLIVSNKTEKSAVVKHGKNSGDLNGLSKLLFAAADAWFEEDEEIFVHPKDPYKRVDVLQSSRHIRVEVNGVEVANTKKPRLLFETLLPVRTYIPKTDCRLDLLEPSELTTQCPYKGVASYYSVRNTENGQLFKDIVWWYRTPLNDCLDIKGYVAFYDEKVDVWVDGEKQERPKTHFT